MAALFYDPTTNALTVPSRPALTTSALMAQDPARYDIYGGSLDLGMTNTSALPANDPDAKYADLVKRFLQEGNSYEKSKQMALDMVDPIVTSGAGPQVESGDPEAAMQAAMQAQATANPNRSFRDMSQGAQEARGALASVNTGTSGEPPVLAAGPRLTPLGEALVEAKNGLMTKINNIIDNGLSVTYQGNEVFAIDGNGTATPITAEDAEIIESQTGEAEQDPTAITGPFMGGYGQDSVPAAPALTTPSTDTKAPQTDKGVLTAPSKPTQSTVRSTTGGYTGNARGSALPDMQIGLNERLMRMGAAGLAAGGQGSLAQMGAMFGASADVNQANRQAEMEAFGIEEERRQAHAARVAALAASKNKGADAETGAASTSARIALDNANAVLQGFDDFDGVTGPFNWFVSGWDSSGFGDAGRANVRLKIAKMKVDSTLARVAETKGAISEKEMEIFESDQPSFYASEDVWREWVTNYIRALNIMHTNLSTGQTPYKNGGGGASNDQETEDLVKKYTN